MTGSWRGWMAARPRKPRARPWAQDAARVSRSRVSGWTDWGGGASPAARAATTTRERHQSRPASARTPRSARRSASPSARPRRVGWAVAMAKACSMPRAVSSRACSPIPGAVARVATRTTSCGAVTFGSRRPERPGRPSRAWRSGAARGLSRALIRTWTGTGWGSVRRSAVAVRAYSLRSGATASSRSTTTTSAPDARALDTTSGRSPGTYSQVRGMAVTGLPRFAGRRWRAR